MKHQFYRLLNSPEGLYFSLPFSQYQYRFAPELHFTIKMTNSGGGRSTETCHTTLDISPPTGSVLTPKSISSDPTQMSAEIHVRDETRLSGAWVALGRQPGVGGDQVVAWRRVTLGPFGLPNAEGELLEASFEEFECLKILSYSDVSPDRQRYAHFLYRIHR